MSIRNAFTAATTGTLSTVTSTMAVVSTAAESLERISEVGLITATGWRDSALADQDKAKIRRDIKRVRDHKTAVLDISEDVRKIQRKLDQDPELASIYYELLGETNPKLRVAAE